jgi:hypothetical protein
MVKYKIGDRKYELPPRYIRTHTICRPQQVVFTGGEKQQQPAIQPQSGAEYVVTGGGKGGVRVKKK